MTKAWGCSLDELKKENRKLKEQNLLLKSDLEQVFSTEGQKRALRLAFLWFYFAQVYRPDVGSLNMEQQTMIVSKCELRT